MDAKMTNEVFAQKVVDGAMAEVRRVVAKTGEDRRGFGEEIYYAIDIPFEKGSEEHAFYCAMLDGGNVKNPDYTDLFERIIKGMKQALDAEGLRAFTMLNCRFNASLDDNFLFYIYLN